MCIRVLGCVCDWEREGEARGCEIVCMCVCWGACVRVCDRGERVRSEGLRDCMCVGVWVLGCACVDAGEEEG